MSEKESDQKADKINEAQYRYMLETYKTLYLFDTTCYSDYDLWSFGTTSLWGKMRHVNSSMKDNPERMRILRIEGINLIAKDASGTSDPYVKMIADPAYKKISLGKVLWKSEVKPKTLNPVWDYSHPSGSKHNKNENVVNCSKLTWNPILLVQIFDHDRIGFNDFMGEIKIDLLALKIIQKQYNLENLTLVVKLDNKGHTKMLLNRQKCKSKAVSGAIILTVDLLH